MLNITKHNISFTHEFISLLQIKWKIKSKIFLFIFWLLWQWHLTHCNIWLEQGLLQQKWHAVVKDHTMGWDSAAPCRTSVRTVTSMRFGMPFIQQSVHLGSLSNNSWAAPPITSALWTSPPSWPWTPTSSALNLFHLENIFSFIIILIFQYFNKSNILISYLTWCWILKNNFMTC